VRHRGIISSSFANYGMSHTIMGLTEIIYGKLCLFSEKTQPTLKGEGPTFIGREDLDPTSIQTSRMTCALLQHFLFSFKYRFD
jgi:hypothetical protein